MYESGTCVKHIAKGEQSDRTIYKYLNLAYLSPKIINNIMDGKIPSDMPLQKLFTIGSKYYNFEEQENGFYKSKIY